MEVSELIIQKVNLKIQLLSSTLDTAGDRISRMQKQEKITLRQRLQNKNKIYINKYLWGIYNIAKSPNMHIIKIHKREHRNNKTSSF